MSDVLLSCCRNVFITMSIGQKSNCMLRCFVDFAGSAGWPHSSSRCRLDVCKLHVAPLSTTARPLPGARCPIVISKIAGPASGTAAPRVIRGAAVCLEPLQYPQHRPPLPAAWLMSSRQREAAIIVGHGNRKRVCAPSIRVREIDEGPASATQRQPASKTKKRRCNTIHTGAQAQSRGTSSDI